MNVRKRNRTMLIILLLFGALMGLFYWLWVKSIALPIIGQMEQLEGETISGKDFTIKDGKLKLITFVKSGCSDDCQAMFADLEQLQKDLIDEKAFVARAEIITVAENPQQDKEMLSHFPEKYNMEQKGWNILLLPPEQLNSLHEQLADVNGNDDSLILIDANGKIRQSYTLNKKEDKEQLIKDIRQLIRIQQQSIEEKR